MIPTDYLAMSRSPTTQIFTVLFYVGTCLSCSMAAITVTVMTPASPKSRHFSLAKVKPAVHLGIEEIRRQGILPEINVTFVDTEESAIKAPVEAFKLIRQGRQHVFLGPVGDYALSPVGRYAPYWNIPILTPGGFSHDFKVNRKNEYPTLIRTGPSFDSVSAFIELEILQHYKWRKISLIYDRDDRGLFHGFDYLMGSAFVVQLRDNSMQLEYDIKTSLLHHVSFDRNYTKTLVENVGGKYGGKWSGG